MTPEQPNLNDQSASTGGVERLLSSLPPMAALPHEELRAERLRNLQQAHDDGTLVVKAYQMHKAENDFNTREHPIVQSPNQPVIR